MKYTKKFMAVSLRDFQFMIDKLGNTLAACGFLIISFNYYLIGFIVGLISCILLLNYLKNKRELKSFFYLQIFFLICNINGTINNWSF